MRTLIWVGSSGLRLKRCAPHSAQKHFSKPPSGWRQALTSSSPATSRNVRPSIRTCADAAVPVRRWHRVQWQYPASWAGSVSSKRTPPHRQPPEVEGSVSSDLEDVEAVAADLQ